MRVLALRVPAQAPVGCLAVVCRREQIPKNTKSESPDSDVTFTVPSNHSFPGAAVNSARKLGWVKITSAPTHQALVDTARMAGYLPTSFG